MPSKQQPNKQLVASQEKHQQQKQQQQSTQQKQKQATENIIQQKTDSLHSRLNSEAERLLKWKVSMEVELSQREKKLQDTTELIERQRKNLLDLQMQSEELSIAIENELQKRDENGAK